MIVLSEDQSLEAGLVRLLESVAELVLEGEGFAHLDCEVSFSFAAPDEMKALNAKYRGEDGPTDVLSFPMYGSADELRAAPTPAPAPLLLGDIVICREVACEQAEEWGHSAEQELVYLFAHGMLHLLGHGHGKGGDDEAWEAMREIGDAAVRRLASLPAAVPRHAAKRRMPSCITC